MVQPTATFVCVCVCVCVCQRVVEEGRDRCLGRSEYLEAKEDLTPAECLAGTSHIHSGPRSILSPTARQQGLWDLVALTCSALHEHRPGAEVHGRQPLAATPACLCLVGSLLQGIGSPLLLPALKDHAGDGAHVLWLTWLFPCRKGLWRPHHRLKVDLLKGLCRQDCGLPLRPAVWPKVLRFVY
jgi:hypothetical protein